MIVFEFKPDLFIYFKIQEVEGRVRHKMEYLWGDGSLYNLASEYILSNLENRKNCFVAVQRSTLKLQIFDCEMKY